MLATLAACYFCRLIYVPYVLISLARTVCFAALALCNGYGCYVPCHKVKHMLKLVLSMTFDFYHIRTCTMLVLHATGVV